MKRRKKRGLVLKVLIVVFAVCFSCFYFLVKGLYHQVDPDFETHISVLKMDTENASHFHETLELVYPDIYRSSFIGHGISEFFNNENAGPCPCTWLSAREGGFIPHISSIKGRFVQLSKIWAVESTLTQKECIISCQTMIS